MKTRIWFVASKPDIFKAWGDRIFYTEDYAKHQCNELNYLYPDGTWQVYSALVEVEA